MGKINIAEILKDCPKGTKLYSPLCGECKLDTVTCNSILVESITFKILHFNEDGTYYEGYDDAECLLFPSKENRDWSTFQRLFKDGDIVANNSRYSLQVFIFKNKEGHGDLASCYLMLNDDELVLGECTYYVTRFATPDEKQKLFEAIKDNGYKWNPETKTLEKLVEPKFKVGDRIRLKGSTINFISTVTKINEDGSIAINDCSFAIKYELQDYWELVPDKFAITTLKPFDKVLVRDTNEDYWKISMFGYIGTYDRQYFMCIANSGFYQCIPYEGNEHLLGTTNDCDEFYKTW